MIQNSDKGIIEDGFISQDSQYPSISDDELKKLVLAYLSGTVFGSWSIPKDDERMIYSVFMVLSMMSDIQLKEMERDDIVHVYEYMDQASNTSINGYPCFLSCRMMSNSDYNRFVELTENMKTLMDNL